MHARLITTFFMTTLQFGVGGAVGPIGTPGPYGIRKLYCGAKLVGTGWFDPSVQPPSTIDAPNKPMRTPSFNSMGALPSNTATVKRASYQSKNAVSKANRHPSGCQLSIVMPRVWEIVSATCLVAEAAFAFEVTALMPTMSAPHSRTRRAAWAMSAGSLLKSCVETGFSTPS
jgi:hypothetical protein